MHCNVEMVWSFCDKLRQDILREWFHQGHITHCLSTFHLLTCDSGQQLAEHYQLVQYAVGWSQWWSICGGPACRNTRACDKRCASDPGSLWPCNLQYGSQWDVGSSNTGCIVLCEQQARWNLSHLLIHFFWNIPVLHNCSRVLYEHVELNCLIFCKSVRVQAEWKQWRKPVRCVYSSNVLGICNRVCKHQIVPFHLSRTRNKLYHWIQLW